MSLHLVGAHYTYAETPLASGYRIALIFRVTIMIVSSISPTACYAPMLFVKYLSVPLNCEDPGHTSWPL